MLLAARAEAGELYAYRLACPRSRDSAFPATELADLSRSASNVCGKLPFRRRIVRRYRIIEVKRELEAAALSGLFSGHNYPIPFIIANFGSLSLWKYHAG